MAALTAAGQQEIDAVWFQPNDPIATALLHLALARFVRGDLTGAEAELAQVAHRVVGLGFPQGPFSAAFAHFVEIWLRIEAGQLDRAAVLAADLIEQAERHGFDAWQLWGGIQQATVGALVALGAEDLDPTALSNHIAATPRTRRTKEGEGGGGGGEREKRGGGAGRGARGAEGCRRGPPDVSPGPAVAVGELDSNVGVLTAKFPGYTRAHVRDAVYETHRRLAAVARIQTRLIPLTLNRARFQLEDASALSSADRL